MADVAVLNTSAGVSGKTLDLLETDQTLTGLKTFDRDPSAPFAVTASSAVVTNLDSDKLDGLHGAAYSLLHYTNATTTSTGSQNDFAPGLSGHTMIYCNNASDLTITGLAAGVAGQMIVIVAAGAGNVVLPYNDSGSIAANRFIHPFSAGNLLLANASGNPGSASYIYTGSYWLLVAHNQGSNGAFTPTIGGSGSAVGNGTLTGVYRLIQAGRALWFNITWTLGSTSTVGSALTINLPYNVANAFAAPITMIDDSSSAVFLGLGVEESGQTMAVYANNGTAGGAFQPVTTTLPFTWTTNDRIIITGTYSVA